MNTNLDVLERERTIEASTAKEDQKPSTETPLHGATAAPAPQDPVPPGAWTMPKAIANDLKWKRRRETWVPGINVGISVLALLVIFAQAAIYFQQWRSMKKQSEVMKAQTDIMQQSLAVSQQALLDSQQTFRISERAYVGIASLTAKLKAGNIEIMLQNIGHVPAKAVKVEGQEIRAIPAQGDERTASGERVNEQQRGSVFQWEAGEVQLFPGTPMPIVISSFKPDEVQAILAKKEILYLGGVIQYEDGFGKTESTTFAFKYDPSNDRWIADRDLSRFFKRNEP